jgi:hypothetical protein
VETAEIKWNAEAKQLSGTAKVIGGEPFKMVIADNGRKPVRVTAKDGTATLKAHAAAGLSVIILERHDTGDTAWQVEFE